MVAVLKFLGERGMDILKKFKLGVKIRIGFGSLILILVILGAVSAYGVKKVGREMAVFAKWSAIDMVMNEAVIANALKLQTAASDYTARREEREWSGFQTARNNLKDGIAEWRETVAGESKMEQVATGIRKYLDDLVRLGRGINREDVDGSVGSLIAELENAMESIIDPAKEAAYNEAARAQQRTSSLTFWITVAGVIVSVFLAILISGAIVGPLRRVIDNLSVGAEELHLSSRQIEVGSQVLAEGSSEQAASLEEISASIEEMASMTKQNADNSRQADNLMKEANGVVIQASDSMGKLINSMEEISKASEETSKIVKTIDEIAFQTNLLALNAAVEAARAGEAGAGFAVVADEVRNLAMRAAEASKNTTNMIDGTVGKVRDGSALVAKTNEAFSQVTAFVDKVGGLVTEITMASNDQAQGIDQISTAMANMDSVVQRISSNAEESAAASEEMDGQASQVKDVVQELVALVGGKRNAGTMPVDNLVVRGSTAGATANPCWEIKNCPPERQKGCPAHPQHGDTCWKVTGTMCGGEKQGTYNEKMDRCRQCEVYKNHAHTAPGAATPTKTKARAFIPFDDDKDTFENF